MNLKLKIDDESHEIEILPELTILENLKSFSIPWSCLEGHCSTCMCKLISGEVNMLENLALTDKEVKDGFILTCQSYAKSDIEIDFDY